MAIYGAYFDVGGSYDDPACRIFSMAGFIATERRWEKFSREWRAVLDAEGVSVLHMRSFAHSTGEFKGWKGDEPRRQRLIASLTQIIRDNTQESFSLALGLEPYRSIDQIYQLHESLATRMRCSDWP